MTQPALTIDVFSDVVCPWCYLGKRRLDQALARVPEIPVAIRWRPFRLDPTIPPEGIDRAQYIDAKFGSLDAIEPAHKRLVEMGKPLGIDYRFDAIGRSPNTVDAHRLVRWAAAEGKEEAMVERLFAAYFTEGKDIGDPAVLAELAGDVGLAATVIARRLASDEDREAVALEVEDAYRIGVTGVPCFVLAGKYAVMGAQEIATMADAIRQVAAEVRQAEPASAN